MFEKIKQNLANEDKNKLYFAIFIGITVVVLIAFGIIMIGGAWKSWSDIWQLEDYYKELSSKGQSQSPLILLNDPVAGPTGATATVFEYCDIFTPACQTLQKDIKALLAQNSKVRLVYKAVPLSQNPENANALIAAYCANEQNKFFEFIDLLYQNTASLGRQKYLELAAQIKINQQSFSQCLESNTYSSFLNQNLNDAAGAQVTFLPAVFVDDQKLSGQINLAAINKAISDSQK